MQLPQSEFTSHSEKLDSKQELDESGNASFVLKCETLNISDSPWDTSAHCCCRRRRRQLLVQSCQHKFLKPRIRIKSARWLKRCANERRIGNEASTIELIWALSFPSLNCFFGNCRDERLALWIEKDESLGAFFPLMLMTSAALEIIIEHSAIPMPLSSFRCSKKFVELWRS